MARSVCEQVVRVFGPLMFRTRIHQSDCVGRGREGRADSARCAKRREAVEYQLVTEEVIARVS